MKFLNPRRQDGHGHNKSVSEILIRVSVLFVRMHVESSSTMNDYGQVRQILFSCVCVAINFVLLELVMRCAQSN